MKYQIYNQSFSSKKKATDYTRILLRRNYNETITEGEDFNYIMAMVNLHPDKENKIGNGILSFFIGDDAYKNTALFINQKIKKKIPISWITICNFKAPSKEKLFIASLRQAIDYQILEFRQKCKRSCEFCGSKENIHIDHIYLFKNIYKDFMDEYNFKIPEFYSKEEGTNRCKLKDTDNKIRLLWCEYHKEKATLRPLCKTCNLSRGYK